MPEYKKPLPIVTADSLPYWEAAHEHRFSVQRCDACGRLRFPPSTSCWSCLSPATEWVELSGRGTVWSYILMHQPYYASFQEDLPYPVAVVETDEGLRILTSLVAVANEDISIGMPVEVTFDDVTPEVTLPKFRPATK